MGGEWVVDIFDTNIVRDLPVIALQAKPQIGKLSKRDVQDFIAFLGDK